MNLEEKDTFNDGQYKILGYIGKGAHGEVYKIRNEKTNEILACKTIFYNECFQEAELLRKLSHEHILKHFDDFSLNESKYCIITEFCEDDLEKRIILAKTTNLIDNDLIGFWFKQSVIAIEYIHSQDVIHRDIKPSNIFLKNGNLIKIGDFGVSVYESGTLTKTVIGTTGYMSPEMIQEEHYSFNTDIWSLGCVLFELITLEKYAKAKLKTDFSMQNYEMLSKFKYFLKQMLVENNDTIQRIDSKKLLELVNSEDSFSLITVCVTDSQKSSNFKSNEYVFKNNEKPSRFKICHLMIAILIILIVAILAALVLSLIFVVFKPSNSNMTISTDSMPTSVKPNITYTISFLNQEMLRSLGYSLDASEISLIGASIKQIDSSSFKNFSSLRKLMLQVNSLTHLNETLFNDLINLKVLNLSHNLLKTISTFTFCTLLNLNSIDLSYNQIKTIDFILFNGLNSLTEISLEKNQLQNLFYTNMTNLYKLNLNQNNLTSILLDNFTNLKYLIASSNQINTVPTSNHKSKLVTLDLSNNQITELNRSNFLNLTNLEFLDLNSNQIHLIEPYAFYSLFKLRSLNLSDNQLTYIDSKTFNGLVNLKSLFLHFNQIELVNDSSTLTQLVDLKWLDLHSNKLKRVPNLRNLNYLEMIYLDNNKIESLENELDGLQNLWLLSFYNNLLNEINQSVFHTLDELISLDLSSNKLTQINSSSFEHTIYLRYIYLNSNQIKYVQSEEFNLLNDLNIVCLYNNSLSLEYTSYCRKCSTASSCVPRHDYDWCERPQLEIPSTASYLAYSSKYMLILILTNLVIITKIHIT